MSLLRRWLLAVTRVPAYVWAALLLTLLLVVMALATRGGELPGALRINHAERLLPGQAPGDGTQQALPHVWDNEHRRWSGQVRYVLRLPSGLALRDDPGDQGIGLLLPRVGVRFRVLLNGQEVLSSGWRRAEGYFDAGTQAHFVALPQDLLKPDPATNRIEVQLSGQALRISGLGEVWVGPRDALMERYRWLSWWQVELTWMVAASALIMGLLSLLIWVKTGERLFGLLAGGALVLTLRLGLSTPLFISGSFLFWDFLHKLSFSLYCGFMYLFMSELFKFRQSLARRLVLAMMWVSAPCLVWLAWSLDYNIYRAWTGVILLVCLVSLVNVLHRARWGMDVEQRLMVVVGLATMVTGLRDYLVVQLGYPGDADVRWMTAGSLVLLFSMGWILVHRSVQSMQQVARLNSELARQVDEREEKLHTLFDQLRLVESQRVLETERRRLTRDMHDGLGSQLVQTLNLVRSSGESIDSAAVASMVNHALEELRMTLDSLEPMEGDLPTILGTLRQRIAPALAAARIELDWQVEEVPAVPGLEARGVMHLFRCLQEVFANVVKHAHATRVTVRTWEQGGRTFLSASDNGVGLGARPDGAFREGGRGMANIRLRASEIGADVQFSNARPGTCVTFGFASAQSGASPADHRAG